MESRYVTATALMHETEAEIEKAKKQAIQEYHDSLPRYLEYAPAFVIGEDWTSGTVTQKEYSSYDATKLDFPRAFRDDRVIWPADPKKIRRVYVSEEVYNETVGENGHVHYNDALQRRLEKFQRKITKTVLKG